VGWNWIFSEWNDWIRQIGIQYSIVGIIGLCGSDLIFNSGNDQIRWIGIEYSVVG
jgi:hypothetical protein